MNFNFDETPSKRAMLRHLTEESSAPMVSVVTPYYNAHEYFDETLRSVLSQTMKNFEWIIINDGSTDAESIAFLDSVSCRDSRIKVLNKENGGLSSARNYGFENAITNYIVPIDADDLLEPTYLEQCWWALQAYPEASWSYTDTVGFGDHSYLWRKEFDVDTLKIDNFMVATAMIKKSAWREVMGYDEDMRDGYEDWHFWLKLVKNNHFPVHIKDYGFWYRRRPNSMLRNIEVANKKRLDALKLITHLAEDVKKVNPPIQLNGLVFKGNDLYPVHSDCGAISGKTDHRKVILFIFPWLNMGGADKFNLDLIRGLDTSKFRSIICTTVPSEHKWSDRFCEITDEVYHLPNFLPVEDWSRFLQAKIILEQVDIVFISNSEYGYNVLPWLKESTNHDFKVVDYVHMEERYWKNGGYARFSSNVSRYIDKTYVTSENLKNTLINNYEHEADSVSVVYINVDASYFNPNVEKVIQKDGSEFVILFPCRLHQQKRPFLAIEIARKLKVLTDNFSLWVVGDGPEESAMRSIVAKYNLNKNIKFFGAVRDVRPYYQVADCTLICSIKEGLSLTAYESMAMGTPVITSDVGGQKELVTKETGYVVPLLVDEVNGFGDVNFSQEEIELYVNSINELIEDPELSKELGRKARLRILSKFLIKDMIETMEINLTDVLKINTTRKLEAPQLAKLFLQTYIDLLKVEKKADEIWEARCYFENLASQNKLESVVNPRKFIFNLKKLYNNYKSRK